MNYWSVEQRFDYLDSDLLVGETDHSDLIDSLMDELINFSPAIGFVGNCLDIRISIECDDIDEAIHTARDVSSNALNSVGLSGGELTSVSAATEAELDAFIESSEFPKMVGVKELADSLKVTKQRVSELARSRSFPMPVATLASGPIWLEPAIEEYMKTWSRKPGRPKKVA